MEFISDIDVKEYEEFVKNADKTHFMQSSNFGEIRKEKGFIPHYVGLKDNGKLLCTALLLEKKLVGKLCYYYVPRGYVIDYKNKELLKVFTEYIYKYAKSNHSIFVKIDPDIKRHTLDADGNIIDGEDNNDLIDYLKKLGYKHHGFNKGFENEQPRFTFRLNIDKDFDKVYSGFHATTRKILNKGNRYKLNIYKGSVNDIDDFYITMKETSKREGILQAPVEYYKTFYEVFNKDNESDLYVVKANIDELKKLFKENINEVKEQIESLNPDRYKNEVKNGNKKQDLENQLRKLKSDYLELEKITDKEVVLSSIITVKYKDMVWTVHGGNNSCLMNLNANYLLYYTIIKDACEEGYKVIDFFGTCGYANPSKDNPIYGIHLFKKRLGGEYTEFIGEFDLVVNKLMYLLFTKLVPFYRKVKRKVAMK